MSPIIAKGPSGEAFIPAPAGVHQAVCVDVVDLGELEITYAGETKIKHMIRIIWQIEEEMPNGKPFIVASRYNLSLHENATLRKVLESWRGRPFTTDEIAGFDVEKLIGVNCQLNVVHKAGTKGGTFANVDAVMPLGKKMAKIEPRDYVRVIDRTPEQTEPEPPPDLSDIPFCHEDM